MSRCADSGDKGVQALDKILGVLETRRGGRHDIGDEVRSSSGEVDEVATAIVRVSLSLDEAFT